MSSFDFTRLMRDFSMTRPVVVGMMGNGDPIVAYTNEHNGRCLAHIRALYQDKNGAWCPSNKGNCWECSEMTDVLLKLAERFVGEGSMQPPPAPEPTTYRPVGTRPGLQPRPDFPTDHGDEAALHAAKMPKMSNGLEGLARLKSSMGKQLSKSDQQIASDVASIGAALERSVTKKKKSVPARFKSEKRRSR